jgi:hypothetical protein
MKNSILILIIIFTSFSCGDTETKNVEGINKSENTVLNNKKTQALILTQDFEYDHFNKDKVTGDYVKRNKLTIPQNLATQSKWIMFEGPVLENDLVAYRYYADSRHRFDIYGKTVSDLVMDTVSWKYHEIMNWGSDILKVGNSLGLGSPAIWYKDSLFTLSQYDEKTIEVLEESNVKSIIRTTFQNLVIDGKSLDLIQDWSIEAGKPWSEIHLKVIDGKLPEEMNFATGIVKHLAEIIQGESDDYFYAMNWGIQSYHEEQMGMAILAKKEYQATHVLDDLSHAYAFKNGRQEVKYRFLSVWERDNNNIKDANGFKRLVEQSTE